MITMFSGSTPPPPTKPVAPPVMASEPAKPKDGQRRRRFRREGVQTGGLGLLRETQPGPIKTLLGGGY